MPLDLIWSRGRLAFDTCVRQERPLYRVPAIIVKQCHFVYGTDLGSSHAFAPIHRQGSHPHRWQGPEVLQPEQDQPQHRVRKESPDPTR